MLEVKLFERFEKVELINKGWSEDKKYCVTTGEGVRRLLRVSPILRYKSKYKVFSMMEQISKLNVPMCEPIEFGTCGESVYCIQSWIDGEDLEKVLPGLSVTEQYRLGLQAGRILKKIHSIPVLERGGSWGDKYSREIDGKIREYRECGIFFEGDNLVLEYIERHRNLLADRPQCNLVWDYNIMNMMYENGELRIIDFEYFNYGDPWNEFCCIVWSALASPYFASGQIRGYFDGEPPKDFFELMVLYSVVLLLSLLSSWAVDSEFGRKVTLGLSQNLLKWHDNMQNPIPLWYRKEGGVNE